jgi:hypothetical protein
MLFFPIGVFQQILLGNFIVVSKMAAANMGLWQWGLTKIY